MESVFGFVRINFSEADFIGAHMHLRMEVRRLEQILQFSFTLINYCYIFCHFSTNYCNLRVSHWKCMLTINIPYIPSSYGN